MSNISENATTEALEKRLRPDEEVKWVVEKDMKAEMLATAASVIPLMFFLLMFGGVPATFVMIAVGPMVGIAVGVAIIVGIPLLLVGVGLLNAKYGTVQYAATTDRFVKIRDQLTTSEDNSVPLNRVRDAEYSEGITDKLFGTGDIKIEGAKGDELSFDDIQESEVVLQKVREEIHQADTVDDRHA